MVPVAAPDDAIDIFGTGGDGAGTLNISTAAAFVVAGAGVPVAKHGNRALSSQSGAADVPAGPRRQDRPYARADRAAASREAGIGFMFAPAHHPAMKHVGPARAELGFRTMFNLLGPQSNPGRRAPLHARRLRRSWVEPLAAALLANRADLAWVVHGRRPRRDHHHRPHLRRLVEGGSLTQLRGHARGCRPAARHARRTSRAATRATTPAACARCSTAARTPIATSSCSTPPPPSSSPTAPRPSSWRRLAAARIDGGRAKATLRQAHQYRLQQFGMEGWSEFFVGEVGAAAALAGLLVVAISINLERILARARPCPVARRRPWRSSAAPSSSAASALFPGQSMPNSAGRR